METAEVCKPKRIRHSYPKSEIIHRFIHSDEYVYYKDFKHNWNSIYGIGDILCIGFNASTPKKEEVYKNDISRAIAVINRQSKRIIVNLDYSQYAWQLRNAIPDDFEVFITKDIPNVDIINNIEELVKLTISYNINRFIQSYCYGFYNVLYGNKRTLHVNEELVFCNDDKPYPHHVFHSYDFESIVHYVKKYKIKKYDWYDKPIANLTPIKIYEKGKYNPTTTISDITIKKVITKKLFTKKEKDILAKTYFYSKYCFGEGIPRKDVDTYFNKELTLDEFVSYITKKKLANPTIQKDWFDKDTDTWNNFIIKYVTVLANIARNYRNAQNNKSEENFREALNKLKELESKINTLEDWRNNVVNAKINNLYVEYRSFVYNRKNKQGAWETRKLWGRRNSFENIQLKLNSDKTTIITSNGASVKLDEGIKMFKFFKLWRDKYPDKIRDTFTNISVGIYNLRFIEHKHKTTDTGKTLDFKDWLIQIGCHSIWLTDVINFIEFYKLEKEFDLETYNTLNNETNI